MLDAKELVSVIIPVYNAEECLKTSIDSVLRQDYGALEIILVDDGSQDKSGEMCDEYARLDSRVKVIHKKNGGQSSARNSGLSVASGEYIFFIDADDIIAPFCISELYNAMSDKSVGIACGRVVYSTSFDFDFSKKGGEKKLYGFHDIMSNLLKRNYYQSVWAKLYRKSLFDNIKFIENRYQEDIAITYLLFFEAKKIAVVNEVIYLYYQREGSIMHSSFDLQKYSGLLSYEERVNFLKSVSEDALYRRYMQQYLAVALSTYYKLKKYLPTERKLAKEVYGKIRKGFWVIVGAKEVSLKTKFGVFVGIFFPYCVGKYVTELIKEVSC